MFFFWGGISRSIAETEDQRIQLNQRIQRLSDDGNILEEKIERKKAELSRAKKRLKSYENIRPGFMDEHEKLEKELQGYFAIYCEKFRTLQYLENQKQKFDEEEAERIQASQNKLAQLRVRLLLTDIISFSPILLLAQFLSFFRLFMIRFSEALLCRSEKLKPLLSPLFFRLLLLF